jgi:5'-3' exoribonuclease 2
MGIQSFYRKLIDTFPTLNDCLSSFIVEGKDRFLYFDFNGMLHPCSSKIVSNYMNVDPKTIDRKKMEEEMFEEIKTQTLKVINTIQPYFIMISIDGVAPRAKQEQQRTRRYKSVIDKKETRHIFDSNSISPGTLWMKRMTEKLKEFIKEELETKYKILFLDASVPGEGEHKIINFIKQITYNEKHQHIIYGLDADLIVLSLTTGLDNVFLLREKQNFEMNNSNDNFNILPIKKLRNYYWRDFKDSGCKSKITKNQYIKELTFLTFFLGNDFLPHLKTISTHHYGLDVLIETYNKSLNDSETTLLENNNIINQKMLMEILKHFVSKEDFYCKKNNDNKKDKIVRYYEDNWKQRYYQYYIRNNYTQEEINRVCHNYFQTIVWNRDYYLNRKTNWSFYYSYNFSPCISDLYLYLENNNINKIYFQQDQPYTQMQQLMIILPSHSSYLLPKKYSSLMFGKLRYMYPRRFNLDKVDKYVKWKWTPILPQMNDRVIKQLVR